MLPQTNFNDLAPDIETTLQDPQAQVRLLYLIAQLLTDANNREVYRLNEAARKVDVERRITLAAGGFQLLDYGITSDYFQIYVEDSTNTTTVEIHHGEFLGISPRLVLPTGRYCQLPASSPRLLLRNSGTNPATIVAVLTNRKMVIS